MKIRARRIRVGAAVLSGAPVWVPIPELGDRCEMLLSPYTADVISEQQVEGVLDIRGMAVDISAEARSFFRRIVHDWRGLDDSVGSPILYTTANRDAIAGIGHDVRRVIQAAAKELAVGAVEDEEENSERSSGGTTGRTGSTGEM